MLCDFVVRLPLRKNKNHPVNYFTDFNMRSSEEYLNDNNTLSPGILSLKINEKNTKRLSSCYVYSLYNIEEQKDHQFSLSDQ